MPGFWNKILVSGRQPLPSTPARQINEDHLAEAQENVNTAIQHARALD